MIIGCCTIACGRGNAECSVRVSQQLSAELPKTKKRTQTHYNRNEQNKTYNEKISANNNLN